MDDDGGVTTSSRRVERVRGRLRDTRNIILTNTGIRKGARGTKQVSRCSSTVTTRDDDSDDDYDDDDDVDRRRQQEKLRLVLQLRRERDDLYLPGVACRTPFALD